MKIIYDINNFVLNITEAYSKVLQVDQSLACLIARTYYYLDAKVLRISLKED